MGTRSFSLSRRPLRRPPTFGNVPLLGFLILLILPAVISASTAEPPRVLLNQRVQVAEMPDGRLMMFTPRKVGEETEVLASTSVDGEHWTDPVLVRGASSWGVGTPLITDSGEIHFFLTKLRMESGRRFIDVWHQRTTDGGKKWLEPVRIFEGYVGALMGAIRMRNGRILLPFAYGDITRSWRTPATGFGAFTYRGQHTGTVLYSDDEGATWRQSNDLKVETPDLLTLGAVEPVVIQLKDGRVWMMIRTEKGRYYESFSDDGAVWSRPRPSSFISSDSPAGLTRLPDGRLVILWNNSLRYAYAYGGRQVLHGAISDDDGKTWRGYREVYRDPHRNDAAPSGGDHGTAYPVARSTKNGRVYFSTGQGPSTATILLDPDWLLESSQREDFSHGLDDWSVYGTKGVELHTDPAKNRKLLTIRKIDPGWPSTAVLNFPAAKGGHLLVKMRIAQPFVSATITLTDHYSVPFDPEAELNALYTFTVASGGLPGSVNLNPGVWHLVALEWNSGRELCSVSVDGRLVSVLRQMRRSSTLSYIRFSSMSETSEASGLDIEYVETKNVSNN
jgi:BNR repeat-like domain